ncbi:MAG: hypothetical protein ACOY4R_27795 [Pseudomonadota bacterium]
MLEEALGRAGVTPEKITSETVEKSLDQFNIMFDEMLNLGMQLWGRDQVILPVYQNRNQVSLPLGTSLVLSVNQRYMTRATALNPFSTEGGDAALAFDDDFDTACTQTAPNGSIGCYFASDFQVTTVGILFASAGIFGIFYEYTTDAGATWTAIDSADLTVADGEWVWRDLQGVPTDCDGFRIRSVSDDNLSVSELYFGNNPTEIPLGAWNLDDWNAMTVKNTPGVPWNWYQDRQLQTPVLYIWPMPNDQAKYYQLVCWRRRYLDQVTALTQSMDLSRRWYEAITASLARRLCRSLREADFSRYQILAGEEREAIALAAGEERDPSPMRFDPGLSVYTR